MDAKRRILKNTIVLFLSDIFSKILSLITIAYTARYFGVYGFGTLTFALAITSIFSSLADMGISNLIVREIARDRSIARKHLGNAFFIKIILSIFTCIIILLMVALLGYTEDTIIVVILISLYTVITSFTGLFYSIFQAYEQMEYQSIGQIFNVILMLVSILSAMYLHINLIQFSLTYVIVALIVFIYALFVCVIKFVIPEIEMNIKYWLEISKDSIPFGLTNFFTSIYYWASSLILSYIVGNDVVGWYNAAYRLIITLVIIPGILTSAIFPLMSKLYIQSEDKLHYVYKQYLIYLLILALPMGFGTTVLADKIILVIYGEQYIQSIIILQILIWSVVMIFVSVLLSLMLYATNNQIIVTKQTLIAAIINIILNIILVTYFSYVGASFATLITEFFAILFLMYFTYKIGYPLTMDTINKFLKIIFSCIIMSVYILLVKEYNIIFVIASAIIVYSILILFMKIIDKDDIEIMTKLI